MKLPLLISCKISNFSLYGGIPEVEVDLDKSVIVLAGANGLGKSTFLNILSFALTGMVKNFDYEFKGIYDIDNMNFQEQYFDGRIEEADRAVAKVELTFKIGEVKITVKRMFKGNGGFYSFTINDEDEILSELEYQNTIVKEIGLSNFEQFIFIVHYVLIFDESRNMVFWNTRVLTNAINIFLGLNTDNAEKADSLAKKINTLKANVNHTSWDISKLKSYMNELKNNIHESTNEEEAEAIINEIESLEVKKQKCEESFDDTQIELNSVKAIITELTAREYKLKKDYDNEYNKMFSETINLEMVTKNEYILNALEDQKCLLCGKNHIDNKHILSKLQSNTCPLCNSEIKKEEEIDITILEELDKEINNTKTKIKNAYLNKDSILEKHERINDEIRSIERRLEEIKLSESYKNISTYEGDNRAIKNLIDSNNATIQLLQLKKKEFEEERDKYIREANEVRTNMVEQYNSVKSDFIPIFGSLAKEFLGMDVNLNLNELSNYKRPEFKFTISIDESDRLFIHQLSESQKFFIDIALRMSFIIYISKQNEEPGGFLLLDTPEGSLDIAYEMNAGKMMSKYTRNSTQLLMTTNINSSGLLASLAKTSSKENFKLVRMINWATLSLVQKDKLNDIETILDKLELEVGKENEYAN